MLPFGCRSTLNVQTLLSYAPHKNDKANENCAYVSECVDVTIVYICEGETENFYVISVMGVAGASVCVCVCETTTEIDTIAFNSDSK